MGHVGDNFGDVYGNVTVSVASREALVLKVAQQKLTIRVPPHPGQLEPLIVSVAGKTTKLRGVLKPGRPPHQRHVGALGAPRTFYGAREERAGVSSTGTNQRILIIMCHPIDKSPTDGGLTENDERQRQIDVFEIDRSGNGAIAIYV